jgi:serine/threonine protein kinase
VFFAMEFLDGKDLATHVREDGPMSPERVRHIGVQVCHALQAAHEKGITHRDMKPENVILIDRPGRQDIAKILDFGIAKMNYIDGNADRLTRAGMVFGTPEYMAPEQASGDNPDHRVDIYSVGCILYELITSTAPFRAGTVIAILSKQLFEQPEPPRQRAPNADVPAEMEAVIMRALEKDRAKRYQSMKELADALAATGGTPETVAPAMSLEAQARARRTSGWAILTGLLLDAGIALESGELESALNNAERVVQALGGTDVPELASHLPLLESIYTLSLGDFGRVVNVANVPADLDPRAAFLISRIDGMSTIEDLIDVSGMPRLLALRLLVLLLRDTVLVAR